MHKYKLSLMVLLAVGIIGKPSELQGAKQYNQEQLASALISAATHGNVKPAQRILKAGGNPNACADLSYKTALQLAIEGNHVDFVDLLLQQPKINVGIQNDNNPETALHLVIKNLVRYRVREIEFFRILHPPSGYKEDEKLSLELKEVCKQSDKAKMIFDKILKKDPKLIRILNGNFEKPIDLIPVDCLISPYSRLDISSLKKDLECSSDSDNDC